MARIIHDDQGGQTGSSAEGHLTVMQADGQSKIALPEGDFMDKGDILRDGQDLILQSSDGREIVIEGYFSAMPAPLLTTPHGSQLTPELVQSFVKSEGATEYAANDTETDASAVGIVKEVSGDATITRVDGTSEKVTLGMNVHQGDVIETTGEGAVNIVFLDESTFAISSNARMAIDEYVFDPSTQSGETNVSILRGMFVFTSGLIGRDDPDDVQIDTPVGSIGIRGTTIAGRIDPNGESQITVVEGAIVIKNGNTEVTLADQYETVKLTGFDAPIQMVGTLDADAMKGSYGVIGTVAPAFMNTLNTAPTEEKSPDGSTEEQNAPVDAAPEDAPVDEQGQVETEQPVLASYDIFSDPLNTGFDLSVMPEPVNPFDSKTTVTASLLGASSLPLNTTTLAIPPVLTTDAMATITSETVATPVLLPLEVVVEIFVDDDALAGDVVGRVFTTINFPEVEISFANVPLEGGLPVFELVQVAPGVYNVILTDAGEDAIDGLSGAVTSLGAVDVVATLPDGRSTTTNTTSHYGDNTAGTPVITPNPTISLDNLMADGYSVPGSAGQGLGVAGVYLGDFDRNGSQNFGVTSLAGIIQMPSATNISTSAAEMRIAGGGDVNGDGYLDFVVGTPYFNTNQGQIRVHSGANTSLYSTNNGITGDLYGSSVALVDFNGDGYADVFNGAKGAGGGEGEVTRFLGNNSMSFTGIPLTGFATGTAGGALDSLGTAMTSLRDYNNDGFGDVAIAGMTGTTSGYVRIYMGNTSGVAGTSVNITVGAIDNYNIPVFDLGDINGDGFSDLMIGETGYNPDGTGDLEGRALITLGGSNGAIGLNIVSDINSRLVGGGAAGDFNGDGYDDIFIAIQTGTTVDAYVLYGSAGMGGTLTVDASWLTANQGNYYHMTLDLTAHGSPAGFGISGMSIGDQNGDGFEDLLLTSDDLNNGDGGYYVVYGRADPFDLAGPDPEVHTDYSANAYSMANAGANMITSSNGDGLVGSADANIMANLNGGSIYNAVSFQAGAGNDIINLHGTGNMARVIDGGAGRDELRLFTTGNIDFRNISEMSGIEKIAFNTGVNQSLTIGLNDVFGLLQTSQEYFNAGVGSRYTLMVANEGGGTKELVIENPNAGATMTSIGFTINGTHADGGNTYDVYTFGAGYQLLVEQGITITVQ